MIVWVVNNLAALERNYPRRKQGEALLLRGLQSVKQVADHLTEGGLQKDVDFYAFRVDVDVRGNLLPHRKRGVFVLRASERELKDQCTGTSRETKMVGGT